VLTSLRFVGELIDVELEQLRDAGVRSLVPAAESIPVHTFLGDPRGIEFKEHVIAGEQVMGAGAGLELLELLQDFAVVFEEGKFVAPAAAGGWTSGSGLATGSHTPRPATERIFFVFIAVIRIFAVL
jgi:hypothetical protein